MPSHDEQEKVVGLERANADLRASLKRCRDMLADYRAMLTANSNDKPLFKWAQRSANGNSPAQKSKGES